MRASRGVRVIGRDASLDSRPALAPGVKDARPAERRLVRA
jgi:hypothetical protein